LNSKLLALDGREWRFELENVTERGNEWFSRQRKLFVNIIAAVRLEKEQLRRR
jgi:hypothetical protein